MLRKVIFPICLFSVIGSFAQKTDTIIRKEGDKEVKIIVKSDASGKKENKEVVVYKKYVIKDGENEEQVLEEIQRQEEGEKSPANARRKEVIIIDGKQDGKVVHRIDVNIPNIDSIEKVVEIELEKAGDEIDKAGKQIDKKRIEVQENVNVNTNGDTTEVLLGNRKIIIVKDGEDTHVTFKRKKGNKWVDEDGNEEDIESEGGEGQGYRYEYNIEEKEVSNENDAPDEADDDSDGHRKSKFADVDWFGLDLGLNNYVTNGELLKAPSNFESLALDTWRSLNVTTHFLPTTLRLFGDGAVNLKTAISLDFNNLRFNDDFIIRPKANTLTLDSTAVLKKNKLVATYVQLPLLLHFRTNPHEKKKSIDFSVGGYVGALIDGKTKRQDENEKVIKTHDTFNLNPLKYGVTARVDFRWIDFYVNYNLSSVFADAQGPNTQLVSAGVNLIDF